MIIRSLQLFHDFEDEGFTYVEVARIGEGGAGVANTGEVVYHA